MQTNIPFPETEGPALVFQGVEYQNSAELAKAHAKKAKISETAIMRRIARGYSVDKALTDRGLDLSAYEIEVNSVIYSGLTEACKFSNVDPKDVRARMTQMGLSAEEAILAGPPPSKHKAPKKPQRGSAVPVTVMGRTFRGLDEACRVLGGENGIRGKSLRSRIERGMSWGEALVTPVLAKTAPKAITVMGRAFRHLNEACRVLGAENGIEWGTLRSRIKRGMPWEEALATPVATPTSVIATGRGFGNLNEACRVLGAENGIEWSALRSRIIKGMSWEEALATPVATPTSVTAMGRVFRSLNEACRVLGAENGIGDDALRHRIERGMSWEEALATAVKSPKQKITYQGIEYDSLAELSRIFGRSLGLKPRAIAARIQNGWTVEEALSHFSKERRESDTPGPRAMTITVKNVEYPSIKAACAAAGISPELYGYRKKKGITGDDLFLPSGDKSLWSKEPRKPCAPKPLTAWGETFPNLSAAAFAYGIILRTLCYRIEKGQTPEEAIGDHRREIYLERGLSKQYLAKYPAPTKSGENTES